MFNRPLINTMPDLFHRRPGGDTGTGGAHSLVELHQVIKNYRTAAGEYPVLKGIELQVGKGEFVAVIGKSGSGKTTLLNMITGIDHPTSGQVFVNKTPVHQLSEGQMAVWRGRNLGIVFQFFQLLPALNLLENVMLPMDFCQLYRPRERRDRAMHLLEEVGLKEQAKKLPLMVSGGQQQRAAIARSLANDPPLIIADEPTGNLDSAGANAIFRFFQQLISNGKTIMMVTHDNELARRATRTLLVKDGAIANEYAVPPATPLSEERVARRDFAFARLNFPPGAIIIHEGDVADKLYVVLSGTVEAFIKDPYGHDIVVHELAPGAFFGEFALLRGGKRRANYRAAHDKPVEIMELDRDTFARLVQESGEPEERELEHV